MSLIRHFGTKFNGGEDCGPWSWSRRHVILALCWTESQ